ncbi:WD domain, G-beta repeat protein [Oesophagostomum dentatum]|uniref:GATOR2 complex protein WDR24 n=1 Tax=Oesophagostomum dentatum TaxID=61180 RepID=A0A0B1SNN8_OESDE|nr:WD domain, G-beta repeat protein [Oesophagostomum dentatum]
MHYKCHQRSATVVHFHRSNENLLISGSRDAAVFLYDLREADPVKKFGGTNSYDVIRDLSFCLHQDQYDQFVTCDDSGTIRMWDARKGDRPLIQFPAHQGYAASIALNPRERHLIASGGGRDKFIKVWNWSSAHPNAPTYQVETMAPRMPYDPFRTPVRSQLSCGLPDNAMYTLQPTAFYKLAEKYLAGGRPLQVLCNHNASLATSLGQSSVAQTWRLVGALLEQTGLQKVYDQDTESAAAVYREKFSDYVKEMERHGKKVPEPPRILPVYPTHLSRFAGNHMNSYRLIKEERLTPIIDQQYEFTPNNVASGDFYFGAGELTKTTAEKGIENPHYNDFTGLKDEAFALKPDLTKLMFMSMSSDDDGEHY